MTLEEAILHCREKANGSCACADDHRQLAEWLTELLKRRKTEPKWISCSEKPITSGLYIVTLKDEKGLFTDTAEWNPTFGGRWQSIFYDNDAIGEYRDISNVVAWMPMPEPAKEDDHDHT